MYAIAAALGAGACSAIAFACAKMDDDDDDDDDGGGGGNNDLNEIYDNHEVVDGRVGARHVTHQPQILPEIQ